GGGAGGALEASSSSSEGVGGGFSVGSGGGEGGSGMPVDCGDKLLATIRDFKPETHPDFEGNFGMTTGIVKSVLGADGKPEYANAGSTAGTTGPGPFAQWYHDVPGINVTIPLTLQLTKPSPGKFVYENQEFFPIDNQGFGNYPGFSHNFHFTTEIHSSFTYKGGENFAFSGDDDVWVFVNKRLAVDLGGLHGPLSANIDFDARAGELGIEKGKTYPLDVFHAERHTVQSNFRIETTIDCFVPEPTPK
ncbi:MAG: fibro-slime domain-containing protein, partial [Deltaproteobacteria bacterium]|nr:fibro-slime domain-containing protein [Deltaproteobacteria bacterium]